MLACAVFVHFSVSAMLSQLSSCKRSVILKFLCSVYVGHAIA
jgi:hypothetical protein